MLKDLTITAMLNTELRRARDEEFRHQVPGHRLAFRQLLLRTIASRLGVQP